MDIESHIPCKGTKGASRAGFPRHVGRLGGGRRLADSPRSLNRPGTGAQGGRDPQGRAPRVRANQGQTRPCKGCYTALGPVLRTEATATTLSGVGQDQWCPRPLGDKNYLWRENNQCISRNKLPSTVPRMPAQENRGVGAPTAHARGVETTGAGPPGSWRGAVQHTHSPAGRTVSQETQPSMKVCRRK